MADGDEHFRIGVQHGLEDTPLYRWQDAEHQERYDAGYAFGQFQRITQQLKRPRVRWAEFETPWIEFETPIQRRRLVRDR